MNECSSPLLVSSNAKVIGQIANLEGDVEC